MTDQDLYKEFMERFDITIQSENSEYFFLRISPKPKELFLSITKVKKEWKENANS